MSKLTKAQLIERLTALGVQHDPEQSNAVLQALLSEAEAAGGSSDQPPSQQADGQVEAQPDTTETESPEPSVDPAGQPGGDLPSDTPDTPKGEGDTQQGTPESEFVRVRLGADAPVGRLVIPGFSGFDRRQTAVISRAAFNEHRDEYHIEEVTD